MAAMATVFVSGHSGDRREIRELERLGVDVVAGPGAEEEPSFRYSEQEWRAHLRAADVLLIATRDRLRAADLEGADRLRAVVKASIGVDRVDLAGATRAGVLVVNSPAPENFIGVAEAVVGLIVAHAKRLFAVERILREGGWKSAEAMGRLVTGSTVGIVGLGRVGSAVARRLRCWDVDVLATDPYREPADAAEVGATLVPLDELLARSDYVSLHVVLNDETRGMIGERELALMKPEAMLINTARGGAVHTDALVRALDAGALAGAALDVHDPEPLPADSPLRRFSPERVILTPHIIGNNRASQTTSARMAVDSIAAVLDGKVPEHVLNPDAIDLWRQRFDVPA
jgi:phosphoglycerate dehydrogenase-like enzyme